VYLYTYIVYIIESLANIGGRIKETSLSDPKIVYFSRLKTLQGFAVRSFLTFTFSRYCAQYSWKFSSSKSPD